MPQRRILSLWFPRLAAERVLRAEPQLAAAPLAVVAEARGALVLASLTAAAEAAGLRRGHGARRRAGDLPRPGHPAGGSRARRPAFLAALAALGRALLAPGWPRRAPRRWCSTSPAAPQLFGGEAGLVARVEAEAAGFGLTPAARARRHPRRRLGGGALRRGRDGPGPCRRRHRPGGARDPLAGAEAALGARRAAAGGAGAAGGPAGSCRRARRSRISGRCRWRRCGSAPEEVAALQALGLAADRRPRRRCRGRSSPAGSGRGCCCGSTRRSAACAEPVSPARPPQVFALRLTLPEPIGLEADVLAGIDRLLPPLCDRLARGRARGAAGAADAGPHRRAARSGARSGSPGPPTGRRRSGRSWR